MESKIRDVIYQCKHNCITKYLKNVTTMADNKTNILNEFISDVADNLLQIADNIANKEVVDKMYSKFNDDKYYKPFLLSEFLEELFINDLDNTSLLRIEEKLNKELDNIENIIKMPIEDLVKSEKLMYKMWVADTLINSICCYFFEMGEVNLDEKIITDYITKEMDEVELNLIFTHSYLLDYISINSNMKVMDMSTVLYPIYKLIKKMIKDLLNQFFYDNREYNDDSLTLDQLLNFYEKYIDENDSYNSVLIKLIKEIKLSEYINSVHFMATDEETILFYETLTASLATIGYIIMAKKNINNLLIC